MVVVGLLGDQVNVAHHGIPFPHGKLLGHQGPTRHIFKGVEHIHEPGVVGPIHFIDKDQMGNFPIVQNLKQGRKGQNPV